MNTIRSKKFRLRVVLTLVALVVVCVAVPLIASQALGPKHAAHAASPCPPGSADTCVYNNPTVQGCVADAQDLSPSQPIYASNVNDPNDPNNGTFLGTIELRHSNTCNASWIRVFTLASTAAIVSEVSVSVLQTDIYNGNKKVIDNYFQTYRDQTTNQMTTYSGMWYGGQPLPENFESFAIGSGPGIKYYNYYIAGDLLQIVPTRDRYFDSSGQPQS